MKTLILTVGISGCGKSTWAKSQDAGHIERDMIRRDFFNVRRKTILTPEKEERVSELMREAVLNLFSAHDTVIVADTNLSFDYIDAWKDFAKVHGFEVSIKKFNVSLDEALARNANRDEPVPESVIRRQYSRFQSMFGKTEVRPLIVSSEKENAIIVDMDGTLRLMNSRSPYDAMSAGKDFPNVAVMSSIIADVNYWGLKLFVLSGATDDSWDVTFDWLASYGIVPDLLLMREKGDNRSDNIVKAEMFDEFIEPHYNVIKVYDDRNQVVEMWREKGLHVFQVANGDF